MGSLSGEFAWDTKVEALYDRDAIDDLWMLVNYIVIHELIGIFCASSCQYQLINMKNCCLRITEDIDFKCKFYFNKWK